MNMRIKKLRKDLELTQQEFADKIGMKRNTIANYETNRNEPSNSVISLICKTFNVSEKWLRTGEGDTFLPTPTSIVDEVVQEYDLDEIDRQIILGYLNLEPKEREVIKRFLQNPPSAISVTPRKVLDKEADMFAQLARDQFLNEKKQESQALSVKESDAG